MPLNRVLGLAFLPNGGCAAATHDVHGRIVHVVLGLELATGWDLHDLQAIGLVIAQPGVGHLAAAALPIGQLQVAQVGQGAALVQRRALALDELLVRTGDEPLLEFGIGLTDHCLTSCIAFQSLGGVKGMSICVMPSASRASITALATAAGAPFVPASPTPLTPSGLNGFGVTVSPRIRGGMSAARGTA